MTIRDELRTAIFSGPQSRFRKEIVKFFGTDVEVRQPSLDLMLAAQQYEDRKEAIIRLIISFCYVPGTEEKVFEDGDKDALLQMPFCDDFTRINEVITRLTNIAVLVEEETKNSEATPGASTSS